MSLRFACTMCGRCCHSLRLPLSVAEAQAWLEDGGEVEVFCEAIPWPEEPAPDNGPAWHKRKRSFAAVSGHLPVRVIVTLVAAFDGACPNLRADMGCGIYERRPTACRVYPAEVNPFVALEPAQKLCPPEAWTSGGLFQDDQGHWTDPGVADAIQRRRGDDYAEAEARGVLCERLGIHEAGLSNEGVIVYAPSRESLREALKDATETYKTPAGHVDWLLVSHRLRTMWLLESAGARATQAADLAGADRRFVSFLQGE
ncbi:YkgJ family cysteine cluster protein [Luteibacter aegosomatissinici]|uniref:YkgJ family cysteine cluster protein n=1 Tax=Luteibacter aegosomatissinici TaxID=2911539 RepID=UPI001FF75B2D|nr:YkgJ family cysteine cluster protein [Luteibacter aegosomatissinici]UPG92568.1 YkgJ family cysteine cluster protein [Luteibacter aegosomatissinici]